MKLPGSARVKMASGKGRTTRQEIVIGIMVLVTLTQLIFHFLVGSNIDQGDEDCSLSGSVATPRCAEAAVFRQWQAAASTEEGRLEELLEPEFPKKFADAETMQKAPTQVLELLDTVSEIGLEALSTTTAATAQHLAAPFAANSTDGGEDLQEAERRIQERMKTIEDLQRLLQKAGANHGQDANLTASDSELLNEELVENDSSEQFAIVAKDLMALQERLHDRVSKLNHSFPAMNVSQAEVASSTEVPQAGASTTNMVNEIWEFGHKLCLDPRRRNRSSCKQFLEGEAKDAASRFQHKVAGPDNVTDPLAHRDYVEDMKVRLERAASGEQTAVQDMKARFQRAAVAAGDDSLVDAAEAPQKATTTESVTLQHETLHVSNKVYTSPYERSHNLHWSEVASWQVQSKDSLRGSAPRQFLNVSKDELRFAKWAGMIPKVACIAVLPYGQHVAAKVQMQYFLDGFKLQTYEGPKQIVLVYHHDDIPTKKLVQKYADGTYIKGMAAMGDTKEPSSMAYRFGAWATDADIIARYDFGAWHHPERLAMQVRALALAKRPACRLLRWTARNYAKGGFAQEPPQEQVDGLGEASLIGEKQWMNKYWYPLFSGEAETTAKAHIRQVAQVTMPELLVYSAEP